VDVASEKNSTLVMPFPVELLRFFDRVTRSARVSERAEPELVGTRQIARSGKPVERRGA